MPMWGRHIGFEGINIESICFLTADNLGQFRLVNIRVCKVLVYF